MLVKDCTKCPLHESRTQIVNPHGSKHAPLFLIGEGPGEQEDLQGRPFVGDSGHVLAAMVRQAGISFKDIALGNTVRCRPPGNRNPKKDEMVACFPYLKQDIEDIQPKVIVTLGGKALEILHRATSIEQVAGQVIRTEHGNIIPTWHPSFYLRGNWDKVPLGIEHLKKAYRITTTGTSLLTSKAKVVRTLEEARAARDVLLSSGMIAFDTETTGLDWITDELLCVQFSSDKEPGVGYIFPILTGQPLRDNSDIVVLGKQTFYSVWEIGEELDEIATIIEDILSSPIPKVAQNAAFDLLFLTRKPEDSFVQAATAFGWTVNNIAHDTMVAAQMVNENIPYNLNALCALYLDIEAYDQELRAQSKNYQSMSKVENEVLWEYAAKDVVVLQALQPRLERELERQDLTWAYQKLQMPLVRLACNLQERGILIDQDYARRLCQHFKEEQEKQEEELFRVLGHETKYGDWRNKQRILFQELKLPIPNKRTDSAKGCKQCTDERPCLEHVSTSADVLEELYRETEHPALPPLIALTKITKFRSTYLDGGAGGYLRWVRDDGRIHARFTLRTSSGRLACESPNIMNIPKGVVVENPFLGIKEHDAIRRMFTAPPGHVIMTVDWSQAEVWTLAYRTGDQVLLDLLLSGSDVHTYVARQLGKFQISPLFPNIDEELDDLEWASEHSDIRRLAKVFVFGTQYGLSAEGAAERLGCSVEEAQKLLQTYYAIVPSLGEYFDEVRQAVLNEPYVIRTWSGRARHFNQVPVLQTIAKTAQSRRLQNEARSHLSTVVREAVNLPIQGGAHDLHIAAWISLEENAKIMERARPVLETHDSLTLEAKAPDEEYVVQTAWMIKELFEDVAKNFPTPNGKRLGWAIPVEVEWGPHLGSPSHKLTAKGEIKEVV